MIQRYEPYENKYECISGPPIRKIELRPEENGSVVLWEDHLKVLELLESMYDQWENGDACYEDPDDYSGYLGSAFKLSEEEENKILALVRPFPGQDGVMKREWHFQVWSFGKLRAEGICVHTNTYEQAVEKAKTFLYSGETLKYDEAEQ